MYGKCSRKKVLDMTSITTTLGTCIIIYLFNSIAFLFPTKCSEPSIHQLGWARADSGYWGKITVVSRISVSCISSCYQHTVVTKFAYKECSHRLITSICHHVCNSSSNFNLSQSVRIQSSTAIFVGQTQVRKSFKGLVIPPLVHNLAFLLQMNLGNLITSLVVCDIINC